MIAHDPLAPLIFIHIPKCAGTSTRKTFRQWFGPSLLQHYYDEKNGGLPERRDLDTFKTPPLVFGHFNRLRGFGVAQYYPQVRQFVTILRDPIEMAISNYYYVRKASAGWKDRSRAFEGALEDELLTKPLNMLNHFPVEVTKANYRQVIEESFIHIGDADQLARSLAVIARKLSKPFDPATVERLNTTDRDFDGRAVTDGLRAAFRERHPLEHAVYDYSMAAFSQESV